VIPKIAYLTSLYPAPSHTFIRREVQELRQRGLEIHTFSVRPPAPEQRKSPEDKAAYGSTYYLLPFRPNLYAKEHFRALTDRPGVYLRTLAQATKHRAPGLKNFALSIAYFLEAIVLAAELKRRGITHVHNHFANASASVSFLATRFLGLAYSLTLHAHSETDYPSGNTLGAKLEACDFAVCISHFGRAQAYRTISAKHWPKLHISRCGIDLSRLPSSRPHAPGSKFRFICVARLSEEKGHIGLLTAYAKLRLNTHLSESELVLVGDGPERANVERTINDIGLKNHVHLRGALPETQTLLEIAKSDALVLASFIEGLPVVLMEAMALRKPTVAPNLAGIPDMVHHGKNGLLFPPADWDVLSLQMERILSDSTLRTQFSREGRATIEESFDISVAVLPLLNLFLSTHNHVIPDVPESTDRLTIAG
jgi:glycosyltransferase involved in cell wall biosynthesis